MFLRESMHPREFTFWCKRPPKPPDLQASQPAAAAASPAEPAEKTEPLDGPARNAVARASAADIANLRSDYDTAHCMNEYVQGFNTALYTLQLWETNGAGGGGAALDRSGPSNLDRRSDNDCRHRHSRGRSGRGGDLGRRGGRGGGRGGALPSSALSFLMCSCLIFLKRLLPQIIQLEHLSGFSPFKSSEACPTCVCVCPTCVLLQVAKMRFSAFLVVGLYNLQYKQSQARTDKNPLHLIMLLGV